MRLQNSATEKKVSAKNLAHDALHDLIHFDTKFLKTLPPLIFKPGVLARDAVSGNENNYVKPFALFVFLNFLFFIFKSRGLFEYTLETYRSYSWFAAYFDQKQIELNLQPAFLTERFNTAMHFEQKEYLVIMVPLFALVLHLLYILKRRNFAEHIVFALYFYSFFIIYLMVLPYFFIVTGLILKSLGRKTLWLNSEVLLTGVILFINWFYLFVAIRKVYPGGYFIASVNATVLSITTYLLIAFVYKTVLFFIVFHSISF